MNCISLLIRIPRSLPLSVVKKRVAQRTAMTARRAIAKSEIEIEIRMYEACDLHDWPFRLGEEAYSARLVRR
jgi:hypothetical protein